MNTANYTQLAQLELDILLNLMSEDDLNKIIDDINDRINELEETLENSHEGTYHFNDDTKQYAYEESDYEESILEQIEKNKQLIKLILNKM